MRQSSQNSVCLIPRIDLHTGYHGTLLRDPPEGVRFLVSDCDHLFLMKTDDRSPYQSAHVGEFIETASKQQVTHSARWPVLGSSSWVADTDDLMYPIMCGRTSYDPKFQAKLRSDDADFRQMLRQRSVNMITAYLHSSCRSILVSGQPRISVDTAREWFDNLKISPEGEDLLAKIQIVRPAQKSADRKSVEEKWKQLNKIRVVFCGRDFDIKNGLLALHVFARLRNEFAELEFIYIGPIPNDITVASPELLHGVIHYAELDHDSTLQIMQNSHVLFHPSKFDSIGIVMLEAMAAGMAVVTARGQGMDYVDDFFDGGGALLIDRGKVNSSAEALAFEAALRSLALDPQLMESMGFRNYDLVAKGEYSISHQNEKLSEIYRCARNSSALPLQISDLPFVKGFKTLRMSSQDVKAEERSFRRGSNLTGNGFLSVTL